MVEIEKPRIECIENPGDVSYGKYVVEPLERGYGTTLGNALRRILLSSLPGTAVTSIKIAGVQHEFTTIPGVKEDVTEIVLNVKRHHRQAALRRRQDRLYRGERRVRSHCRRHQGRRRGGDPESRPAHRHPGPRRQL